MTRRTDGVTFYNGVTSPLIGGRGVVAAVVAASTFGAKAGTFEDEGGDRQQIPHFSP